MSEDNASDSTHERLYLEAKLRDKHTLYRVWDKAYATCRKEKLGRIPVIGLQEKNRPGCLICIHSDDFGQAVVEWLASLDSIELETVCDSVRIRRGEREGK